MPFRLFFYFLGHGQWGHLKVMLATGYVFSSFSSSGIDCKY